MNGGCLQQDLDEGSMRSAAPSASTLPSIPTLLTPGLSFKSLAEC